MKLEHHSTPVATTTTPTDLVCWVEDLMDLHARIAPRFARPEPRKRSLSYLQGVMSEVPRKNGWQLAEHAREATPYGMQRLLSAAVWDEGLVRDDLRDYVYEHLGTLEGILVIDETSFPKSGDKSAGVKEQYCGTTGQVENCQVAVFLDYVTDLGHTLIDCALYLPKEWIDDRQRCREAGIPDTVGFQTKCELARQMVQRIYYAQIPISWVVADTVYGNNLDLRTWLQHHGYWFVLAVECRESVGIRTADGRRRLFHVREVAAELIHAQDWQRLSMGDGTKGPRLYDWVCVPILHAWEDDGQHWLLIRRCIDPPKTTTYYIVFGPHGTTLQQMVTVLGFRWRIEDDFQTSKGMGLDQYEVRRWVCWYRHITLVLLAHALLTVICAKDRKTIIVEASPAESASSATGAEASPAESASSATGVEASVSPLPISQGSALMAAEPPSVSVLAGPPPVGLALCCVQVACKPLPPVLRPAPLTIPEVRHLLGCLIWPASTNATFMLAWSRWRRYHRSMASYYHTKKRLDAG